jgi:uncharacterized protein (DUF885 family)
MAAEPRSPAEFDAAYARLETAPGSTNDPARLKALFDLTWRYQMVESPETATSVGYPGLNDQWSDLSPAAMARRRQEVRRSLRVLATIDSGTLTPDERLYRDLFERALREQADGDRFPEELLAINQMGGPQQEIAQILTLMPVQTAGDVENLLSRLQGASARIEATQNLLREGLSRGVTPPQITLRDVPQQVLNNIPSDPDQSPLFRPFQSLPTSVPETEQEAFRGRARGILTNAVYPSFRELHRFLTNTYLPGARTNLAATSLPDGEAWYAFRVRQSTTTRLSPREIHELGLAEVKRIRGEMELVMRQSGFSGSFAEFLNFLRQDPRFYYTRGTELLAGYRDIAKRVDLELPKLFGRLPRLPYGVLPIPSYSEQSQTTAYYQPGAASFGRPGVFYANTYALNMRPKWEMEALTLHEAVPGHHLQIAIAQELEGVPDFQRNAGITAFVEGWALYSESLGPGMGLYADPYSKFGQLTYEMWRAIRLVVDTGIHSMGWTREQAVDFFRTNSGKTEHDIGVEVDRYIVWPGQALAYKMGELKIKELRAYAEKELGPNFDLRTFHDELLGKGALPLEVLEPRMKEWVRARKSVVGSQ